MKNFPGRVGKRRSSARRVAGFVIVAAACLAGCAPEPVNFAKMNIQAVEVGAVPASRYPEAPAQQGVVAYRRENAGIVRAYYRKTLPCPSRMINSVSGIDAQPDRIVLCFEPVESSDPRSAPLSACPYELVITYEMTGIPESVEPRFEAKDGCLAK